MNVELLGWRGCFNWREIFVYEQFGYESTMQRTGMSLLLQIKCSELIEF